MVMEWIRSKTWPPPTPHPHTHPPKKKNCSRCEVVQETRPTYVPANLKEVGLVISELCVVGVVEHVGMPPCVPAELSLLETGKPNQCINQFEIKVELYF